MNKIFKKRIKNFSEDIFFTHIFYIFFHKQKNKKKNSKTRDINISNDYTNIMESIKVTLNSKHGTNKKKREKHLKREN